MPIGIPELVVDEVTGLLSDQNDAESFANNKNWEMISDNELRLEV